MQNETVEIYSATWEFYTKDGMGRKAVGVVTPHWMDHSDLILDISYYVLKAANAACQDYKECFKQFITNKQTDLPTVKSIHYDKYIGESILTTAEFLRQYGIDTWDEQPADIPVSPEPQSIPIDTKGDDQPAYDPDYDF